MTTPQTPDLRTIKGRQQKAWSSGDYGRVGVTLLSMAEQLAEAADLRSGHSVLDVASGNGNASLAAARRFCDVTAIDYVPMLLEEGRKRAEAEGRIGTPSGVQTGGHHRFGKLGSGRLRWRPVQDHGQIRAASTRDQASLPVGNGGGTRRAARGGRGLFADEASQPRVALSIGTTWSSCWNTTGP